MIGSKAENILNYWFGNLRTNATFPVDKAKIWFHGGDAVNREIEKKFGDDLTKAIRGEFDIWGQSPRGLLALIILLDQFSRNIFGDTPRAFAQDDKALKLASDGVLIGFDRALKPVERTFFYMPYEHSESLLMQEKAVALFKALADKAPPAIEMPIRNALNYAEQHYRIIKRFGRFPHRNWILGRNSTSEELKFLKQPGSSF